MDVEEIRRDFEKFVNVEKYFVLLIVDYLDDGVLFCMMMFKSFWCVFFVVV